MDIDSLHAEAKSRYWNDKDLAGARTSLERGIALAREEGRRDREKALSFDLASFCWPGWDEPGIAIGGEDVAAGEFAAGENLRLAQELQRPAGPMGNAWWMVGAYRLQAGDHAGAQAAFETFRAFAEGDRAQALLAEGYIEIARTLLGEPSEVAGVCERLRDLGGDDARVYADQLPTALRVFSASRPDCPPS